MNVPGWLAGLREARSPLGADLAPMVFEASRVEVDMLIDRLPALASRHEALRLGWPDLSDLGSPQAVTDTVLEAHTHSGDISGFAADLALAGYRRAGKPLWQARLVQTRQSQKQYLVVGVDRMISDPWSLHVLAQELCLLCGTGPIPDLGRLPAQFGAVLTDRTGWSSASDARIEQLHWQRQVAQANFGTDPRVARTAVTPARICRVPLTDDDEQTLVALALEHRTTLLAPVVATVHMVWRSHVQAAETVLITEVGYRGAQELDCAVAPLMEPRLVRIVSDQHAGQLIWQVRNVLLDVLDNSSVPLATDPTPMHPFISQPDRMTLLVEFDTPNRPTVDDSLLNLLDGPNNWAVGPPRADLHVMVRGDYSAPFVYLAHNSLAVTDDFAADFADALILALRQLGCEGDG